MLGTSRTVWHKDHVSKLCNEHNPLFVSSQGKFAWVQLLALNDLGVSLGELSDYARMQVRDSQG